MKPMILNKCMALSVLFFITATMALGKMIKENQQKTDSLFEWTSMPVYSSYFFTSVSAHDGNWLAGGQLEDPTSFDSPPVVVKLSHEGEVVWQYPQYFEWEVGQVTSIVRSHDGYFLIAGPCIYGCDYGPSGVFLHKVSSDGDVVWDQIFTKDDFLPLYPTEILELVDDRICVLSGNSIYYASAGGAILNIVDLELAYPNFFTSAYADSNILLLGHKNGIIKTDVDGNIISEHNFDGMVTDIRKSNNNYLIISGPEILKTNENFDIIEIFGLLPISGYVFNSTVNDEGYVITGNGHILQIDFDLNLFEDHPYETPDGIFTTNISATNSMLFMCGGTSSIQDNLAMAAKTYTLAGDTKDHDLDIGISSITVSNVYAEKQQSFQGVYNFHWDAWATIENFGNETVTSCHIGSKINPWGICGFHAYNFSFQDLAIAPGSSTEIFLEIMYDNGYYVPGNDSSINYTLSLHTRIPNNKIDRDISNNKLTTSFVIDLNLRIREQELLNVNIYPNPCAEHFKIDNPENKYISWNLLSPDGRNLLQGICEDSQSIIDVSGLTKGIYILKLYNENGQAHSEKLLIK